MVASLPRTGGLPVRIFTAKLVPDEDEARDMTTVVCPPFLFGDDTAFVFYLHDECLMPILKVGTLMYCSKLRDPADGDIVVLIMKDGHATVRVMTDVSEDGYQTIHTRKADGDGPMFVEDVIAFDDLQEVAVVVATRRYAA